MNPGHPLIGQDLNRAADILKQGGIVGLPTETVYGLAADALNPLSVAKIFAAKNRPTFDPLIVHLGDKNWVSRVAKNIPSLAKSLIENFWPGPLTIVLEKQAIVPELVTSGLPSVAVRMPRHPVALELLKKLDQPLAAPSANLFGRTSPTCPEHVAAQLSGRIDYILDGGPCSVGVESTIVRVSGDSLEILRPGGITSEQLSEFGDVIRTGSRLDNSSQMPQAPGQLKEHYAPRTPLKMVSPDQVFQQFSSPASLPINSQSGLILLSRSQLPEGTSLDCFRQVIELSPECDLTEAASRFFAAIHQLDSSKLDNIYAISFPEQGLGVALNDRLQRAAAGSTQP